MEVRLAWNRPRLAGQSFGAGIVTLGHRSVNLEEKSLSRLERKSRPPPFPREYPQVAILAAFKGWSSSRGSEKRGQLILLKRLCPPGGLCGLCQ